MAFDIGQKVTSNWTGPGIVTGELVKEQEPDDRTGKPVITAYQMVRFENPALGERLWEVRKLNSVEEE